MKVKSFSVRLNKQELATDQAALNNFLETVLVKNTLGQIVGNGNEQHWSILVFYENKTDPQFIKMIEKAQAINETDLTPEQKSTYDVLRKWRREKAAEVGNPEFMICHNVELMTIAKNRPKSWLELSKIKGWGEQKVANFGDDILELLSTS